MNKTLEKGTPERKVMFLKQLLKYAGGKFTICFRLAVAVAYSLTLWDLFLYNFRDVDFSTGIY